MDKVRHLHLLRKILILGLEGDIGKGSNSQSEFDWDSSDQGIILSAFFWGLILSKVLGSRVAEVCGQRLYVGIAVGGGGILQLLSPVGARVHPLLLATFTFLQGLLYGPIGPSMYSLLAVWSPTHELATMTSTMMAGAMFGIMAGVGIPSWLSEIAGWRSIFWLGGLVSFVVLPPWILIVRNTPKAHPWLSEYERNLLKSRENIKVQKSVPWFRIWKSPYLYICMVGLFARSWTEVLFSSGGPSFLSKTIGLDLSKAGLVCTLRTLSGLITMMIYGRIADTLLKRNLVRKRNVRKIFHFIGAGGMAITSIGIALAGCNSWIVIILWIINGAVSSGTTLSYNVSVIDFAPNYAGTVMGLIGIGNLGSALVPLVTATLLQQTMGWTSSFFLASGISSISCLIFILFMTDALQSWNYEETNKD